MKTLTINVCSYSISFCLFQEVADAQREKEEVAMRRRAEELAKDRADEKLAREKIKEQIDRDRKERHAKFEEEKKAKEQKFKDKRDEKQVRPNETCFIVRHDGGCWFGGG